MADAPLPAKLRQPDVTRLLNRANQLRAHKPAITYWCEYAAVVKIMSEGLHHGDDECYRYTTNLMEHLEKTKAEHQGDDTITDMAAGQAMVEQFAQETFARAERAMHANKATRTTADTFDAAATFFLIGSAWAELDRDTLDKIKYAKWNAARIFKAVREGRDPNETNPKPRIPEPEPAALDPDDPEVRLLMDAGGTPAPPSRPPFPVTAEDVPDAGEMPPHAMSPVIAPAPAVVSPNLSVSSMPDAPPNLPSLPDNALGTRGYFDQTETFAPSPMSQSPGPNPAPSAAHLSPVSHAPSAPGPFYDDPPAIPPELQTQYPPHVPTDPPSAGPRLGSPTSPRFPQAAAPSAPSAMDFQSSPVAPSAPIWSPPPAVSSVPARAPPPPARAPPPSAPEKFSMDEKDIAQAQKHAKWAISALNFDDVSTAVKELRNALAVLGAR